MFASVSEKYGNCKVGVQYRVVEEGYDYLRLRVDGKLICVPLCLISLHNFESEE